MASRLAREHRTTAPRITPDCLKNGPLCNTNSGFERRQSCPMVVRFPPAAHFPPCTRWRRRRRDVLAPPPRDRRCSAGSRASATGSWAIRLHTGHHAEPVSRRTQTASDPVMSFHFGHRYDEVRVKHGAWQPKMLEARIISPKRDFATSSRFRSPSSEGKSFASA
jgi:hypothetical protein